MGLNINTDTPIDTFMDLPGRKFLFLNIRSLLPNINLLRHQFAESNILLLGLCETWLNKRIHDGLIAIDGYNIVRQDRNTGKRGGGLILYIHNLIEFDLLSDLNVLSHDLEMLTILIKLDHQRNFLVSLVYVPPSANKPLAIEIIKTTMLDPCNNPPLRLVAGDYNMEYMENKKRNSEGVLLRSLEHALGLSQLVRQPTRVTTKSSSLIDLLFFSTSGTLNI